MFSKEASGKTDRSSCPKVLCKKGVLRNFTKFTVKHLCHSLLFNKVAGLRLWHRCFPMIFVKFLRIPFSIEHLWWLLLQITQGRWFLIYPFTHFSILNFAMAEWFCHATCFNKVYLVLFFFLVQTWYFCHEKIGTWKFQHFYHKEVMMLSFLHRWDYCWKCEFDIYVKILIYNYHDGEQFVFYKKVHFKMQSKKKDVLVIFIIKSVLQNVKCHNCTWRKLTWMNRNWTGKLQINNFHSYFQREIVLSHFEVLFGRSNLDVFWENEGKIHDGGCLKELFFIKLKVGILQLHNRLTSLQTVFMDFK